jgi:hypothetical protein
MVKPGWKKRRQFTRGESSLAPVLNPLRTVLVPVLETVSEKREYEHRFSEYKRLERSRQTNWSWQLSEAGSIVHGPETTSGNTPPRLPFPRCPDLKERVGVAGFDDRDGSAPSGVQSGSGKLFKHGHM